MVGVEFPEVPVQNPEGGHVVEEPKGFKVVPVILWRDYVQDNDMKLPNVGKHGGNSCLRYTLHGFWGIIGFGGC